MKITQFPGVAAVVAVIVFTMSACASMVLVSIDNESVTGPAKVRQYGTIGPSDITVYGFYKDDSRKQVSIKQSDIIFDSRRPGPQTVNIRTSVSTASFQTEVMALNSLTVASQPTKTLYKIGEDANRSWPGLEIRGEWNQMGSERINLASCQITGFNKDQAGTQTVRVAYEGVSATFNVEVVPLSSLTISSQPTKALFKIGEDADLAWPGLEIQGVWSQIGSDRIPVASCQITGYNKDQAGRQTIRVAYGGQTVTFTVEVLALTSLDLEKPPDKTDYMEGEPMNLAGIVLYGNYTSSTTASNKIRELIPANQLTVSGYDANRIGRQQRITVTVRGQSVNFFVDVTQSLNGTWVSDKLSITFNNGNYEMVYDGQTLDKGTYTANNGRISLQRTHIYMDEEWQINTHTQQGDYSLSNSRTLIIKLDGGAGGVTYTKR